jgi:plasmid stability protein
MANLTITLEDDLLKQARIRALEQGTSVNAVLRDYLEAYAGTRLVREEKLKDLLRLSQTATSRRGEQTWTRDELHER